MARGDKYARANALSKILEEMLRRHSGDKAKAAGAMDDELGPEWRTEIVIQDETGPEFADALVLEIEPVSPDKDPKDEMFTRARKFSKEFVRPGDDLEYDPYEDQKSSKDPQKDHMCVSDILRKLADDLDKKKQ